MAPRIAREQLLDRARKYLAATPGVVEGQGGDAHTFQVCCRLVRGFDLSDVDAFDLLGEWNARCVPPWSDGEVFAKVQGARRYGDEPMGARATRKANVVSRATPAATVLAGLTSASAALPLTTIGELLEEPDERASDLVEGMITTGSVNLLSAKPKVGKSTVARQLALAVARGEPFLKRACYGAPCGTSQSRGVSATFADTSAGWVRRPPIRSESNTDDYAEMTLLFDHVIGIASTSGASVLLLTHNGKMEREGLAAILRSTAIAGSVNTAILLKRSDRYRTISTVQREGDDMEEQVLVLDDETGRVQLGGRRAAADQTAVADQLLATLANAGEPLTRDEWLGRVDGRQTVKLAAFSDLTGNLRNRNLVRTGEGTKGNPYRYAAECADSGSRITGTGIPRSAGTGTRGGAAVICPGCGATFDPVPPSRRFCRPSCRARHEHREATRTPRLFPRDVDELLRCELPSQTETRTARRSRRAMRR